MGKMCYFAEMVKDKQSCGLLPIDRHARNTVFSRGCEE